MAGNEGKEYTGNIELFDTILVRVEDQREATGFENLGGMPVESDGIKEKRRKTETDNDDDSERKQENGKFAEVERSTETNTDLEESSTSEVYVDDSVTLNDERVKSSRTNDLKSCSPNDGVKSFAIDDHMKEIFVPDEAVQACESNAKPAEQTIQNEGMWNIKFQEKMNSIKCILLDIEGTTTSVNFVKDVIFKYIEDIFPDYIKKHWNEEELMSDIDDIAKLSKKYEEDNIYGYIPIPERKSDFTPEEDQEFQNTFVANYIWQAKYFPKTREIKKLQGHLVADGYKNGDIVGHVYEDVLSAFKIWKCNNVKICTFSNGSIYAQHLLFQHSSCGDLENYVDEYFDTTLGEKNAASSYTILCDKIRENPEDILFFTDIPAEAFAAKRAGLQVIIVQREPVSLTDDEKEELLYFDGIISSFFDVI